MCERERCVGTHLVRLGRGFIAKVRGVNEGKDENRGEGENKGKDECTGEGG